MKLFHEHELNINLFVTYFINCICYQGIKHKIVLIAANDDPLSLSNDTASMLWKFKNLKTVETETSLLRIIKKAFVHVEKLDVTEIV